MIHAANIAGGGGTSVGVPLNIVYGQLMPIFIRVERWDEWDI